MPIACDSNRENKPSGFIGYKVLKRQGADIVRIYLNCKDDFHYEGTVDIIFENKSANQKYESPKFNGLDELSRIKKFNRFIGCLEERARDAKVPRERVFESPKQLLALLARVKNSKNFGRP